MSNRKERIERIGSWLMYVANKKSDSTDLSLSVSYIVIAIERIAELEEELEKLREERK